MSEPQTEEDNIFNVIKSLAMPERKVVFEIGAATGLDTPRIISALGFNSGEYYAIEPEPDNVRLLQDVPELKEFGIIVLPIAIGNCNQRTTFYRSSHEDPAQQHRLSGSIKKPLKHIDIHPWCKFDTTIQVPMVCLDDLTAVFSIGPITFIWCDVQGAEDMLIDGAQLALSRTKYFYTEYNDVELYSGQINCEAIFSILPNQWKIVRKWSNDVLFENLSV